jgi:hypothetical protein
VNGRPLPEEVVAAHARAVADGRGTYRDPATGFDVFTAEHLRARGRCCASGCRHCPYDDGAVDHPAANPDGDGAGRS